MLRLISEPGMDPLTPEKTYMILTPEGKMYDADDLRDLVAAICGSDYYESQSAETDWHMRRASAKKLGMMRMMQEELEAGQDLEEDVICYDERWGKIPYSLTDKVVDYDIHVEDPTLIRLESNKSFLYTLADGDFIVVWEKPEDGSDDYVDWRTGKDLPALIEEQAEHFRKYGDQNRPPLFKKLGE